MSRNRVIAGIVVFVVVVVTGFYMAVKADWAEAENAELKAQIKQLQNQIYEWREAAIPALHAAGVKTERRGSYYGDEISPIALKNALNPCHNMRGGQECLKYFAHYNEEVPIQIILKR